MRTKSPPLFLQAIRLQPVQHQTLFRQILPAPSAGKISSTRPPPALDIPPGVFARRSSPERQWNWDWPHLALLLTGIFWGTIPDSGHGILYFPSLCPQQIQKASDLHHTARSLAPGFRPDPWHRKPFSKNPHPGKGYSFLSCCE